MLDYKCLLHYYFYFCFKQGIYFMTQVVLLIVKETITKAAKINFFHIIVKIHVLRASFTDHVTECLKVGLKVRITILRNNKTK